MFLQLSASGASAELSWSLSGLPPPPYFPVDRSERQTRTFPPDLISCDTAELFQRRLRVLTGVKLHFPLSTRLHHDMVCYLSATLPSVEWNVISEMYVCHGHESRSFMKVSARKGKLGKLGNTRLAKRPVRLRD